MSETRVIQHASECSVKRFMDCLFGGKYESLIVSGYPSDKEVMDAWEFIYTAYIDLSGCSTGDDVSIMKDINTLSNRVKSVDLFLHVNRMSIKALFMPYLPSINDLKKFGHRFKWNPDAPDLVAAENQLNIIEVKEARYKADLDYKIKQLISRQKKITAESKGTPSSGRKEFIRLINSLRRHGFQIVYETTSVEELAIMIFDFSEHCEREKESRSKTGKR